MFINIKKYKIITCVLAICVLVLFVINISNQNGIKKYKDEYKAYKNTVEEMIISDYVNKDEEYDAIIKEYKGYIEDYKIAIGKKNINKCEEMSGYILNSQATLIEHNNYILTSGLDEIENSKNEKKIYEYENITFKKDKLEIESLIKEEKYNTAFKKYASTLLDINKISKDLINITQYDFSEFPKVKLYIDGNKLEQIINTSIDKTRFKIVEKIGNEYKDIKIENQGTVKEEGNLNLDIVADVSASMDDYLSEVKLATKNLAENIDMRMNRVGLLSFSDYAMRNSQFSNDKNSLYNEIDNLNTYNMTSLYDSLCESISYTSQQNGSKCIVAFTDGYDNKSIYGYEDVINLANKYDIPIYIIGIGISESSYTQALNNISNSTGGYYTNISSNISYEMENIYNDICKKQKSLYYIEYTDQIKNKSDERNLLLEYNDENTVVRNELKDTITENNKSIDEVGKKAQIASFVKECNYKYFEALNNRDLSIVKDYYSQSNTGAALVNEIKYNINKDEKNNNYYEYCDYKIENITKERDNTYKVTFSQGFTRKSDTSVQSWSGASAIDTVIEINGRFYIDGYEELSNGIHSVDRISNNLIE